MRTIALATLGLCLALPAGAQDDDAAAELEAKTRNVGLTVGKAYGCLAEDDARRERLRLGSKAIFNMIAHDLGTDLAYAFATSAGYGAGQPRDAADCQKIAERWEAIKANFDISTILEEDEE